MILRSNGESSSVKEQKRTMFFDGKTLPGLLKKPISRQRVSASLRISRCSFSDYASDPDADEQN